MLQKAHLRRAGYLTNYYQSKYSVRECLHLQYSVVDVFLNRLVRRFRIEYQILVKGEG